MEKQHNKGTNAQASMNSRAGACGGGGGFESLPYEVVLEVFSYLHTAEDLCALSHVCKQFHDISNDDEVWKPLCSPEWSDIPTGGWKKAYINWIRKATADWEKKRTTLAQPKKPVAQEPTDYDMLVKILFVGDAFVGKSSLLLRFTDDTFSDSYVSTIGADFKVKIFNIVGTRVKAQIWDTAGQERFRNTCSLKSSYYRGGRGFFLVFDLTNRDSFYNITSWSQEIDRYAVAGYTILLIGNKQDLSKDRQIDRQLAEKFAMDHGVDYIETSAKTGANVEDIFVQLVTAIVFGGRFGHGVPGPRPRYIPPATALEKMSLLSSSHRKSKHPKKGNKCIIH
jgi:Ras-related protein Rab-1A